MRLSVMSPGGCQAVSAFPMHAKQQPCLWGPAGEEKLPEDPPEGMFKPVAEPNQLDSMLLSNQMSRCVPC